MHIVFVTRAIVPIHHSILYVLWGLMYLKLFIIAVDYIIITCFDPVDRAILNENYNISRISLFVPNLSLSHSREIKSQSRSGMIKYCLLLFDYC